jgi:SAM-dependent methyltransferase
MITTDIYGSWQKLQEEKFGKMKKRIDGELWRKLFRGVMLDLGCGNGYLQKEVDARFIGLDNDRDMLVKSVSVFPRVLGDGNRLPFADYSFDSIISVDTMHLIESRDFKRVLRPGGMVLFSIFFNDSNYSDRRKMLLDKLGDFVVLDEFVLDTKEKEYVVIAAKPTFR